MPRLALFLVLAFTPAAVMAATTQAGAAPARGAAGLCRPAIAAAERAHGIPHAQLLAIGRVESGRLDPETGRFGPWPWTINAEGSGQYFPTKEAAIAAVRALQARGVRSIDVDCMQINLAHHPNAFASLDQAFDPAHNADYAARFLVDLYARANSWMLAAARYHSHTPDLAETYKRRVIAAWPEETRIAAEAIRDRARADWAARSVPPAGPGRIIHVASTALASASRGRDLNAYRTSPIPLVRATPLLPQRPPAQPASRGHGRASGEASR